jgi:PAS domain S-box-containing protein
MKLPLRVLIVEDSEYDAELLVNELDRSGYHLIVELVDTSATMNAALDKQSWDIIIADYTLPSFNAPAALTLLKEKDLDLPFIIVSGSIGEDIAVRAMKAGAHDYLMKDNLARLVPAVERELREAKERRKRREAEQAVRQNEERFRALIENALDIITVLGTDGIIHYESPSSEKVLGYKTQDLVGKNILDYVHLEDRKNVLNTLKEAVQNPNITLSIEFRFQHQDSSWRLLEAVGKKFLDPSERASIVLNSRDITERKRAEEVRNALLREREVCEGRFNFVSMMSHEFRNPLTTILMASELLKNYSHKTTEDQKKRCLNQIELSSKEMTQLLEDIQSITTAEVGKLELNPQPIELPEFCHKLLEEVQILGNDKHLFNFVIKGECYPGCMDETLLRHILLNLLSNAIKYSPSGGNIQLEISCHQGEVIFQVQDQGIGIHSQDQEKLFETFHRGRNVGKIPGTGLGLCIVKRFVDLHNGKIALKSEVGIGTTFTVILPLNCQISAEGQTHILQHCQPSIWMYGGHG